VIERPIPQLAIVSEPVWRLANENVTLSLAKSKSRAKTETVLTGLVDCGYCDSGDGKRRGAAYNAHGIACKSPHVRGDALEAMAWEDVRGLFVRPDATLSRIAEQMEAQSTPGTSFQEASLPVERSATDSPRRLAA
jgi:hypothetical protein